MDISRYPLTFGRHEVDGFHYEILTERAGLTAMAHQLLPEYQATMRLDMTGNSWKPPAGLNRAEVLQIKSYVKLLNHGETFTRLPDDHPAYAEVASQVAHYNTVHPDSPAHLPALAVGDTEVAMYDPLWDVMIVNPNYFSFSDTLRQGTVQHELRHQVQYKEGDVKRVALVPGEDRLTFKQLFSLSYITKAINRERELDADRAAIAVETKTGYAATLQAMVRSVSDYEWYRPEHEYKYSHPSIDTRFAQTGCRYNPQPEGEPICPPVDLPSAEAAQALTPVGAR